MLGWGGLKVKRLKNRKKCRTVKSFDCANTADKEYKIFISQRRIAFKIEALNRTPLPVEVGEAALKEK
jgi:hypothetical protein